MLESFEKVMTPDEVCEVLRIGKNALYTLLSSGRLKAYRNGRVWRVPKKAVIQYIYSAANLGSNK